MLSYLRERGEGLEVFIPNTLRAMNVEKRGVEGESAQCSSLFTAQDSKKEGMGKMRIWCSVTEVKEFSSLGARKHDVRVFCSLHKLC